MKTTLSSGDTSQKLSVVVSCVTLIVSISVMKKWLPCIPAGDLLAEGSTGHLRSTWNQGQCVLPSSPEHLCRGQPHCLLYTFDAMGVCGTETRSWVDFLRGDLICTHTNPKPASRGASSSCDNPCATSIHCPLSCVTGAL